MSNVSMDRQALGGIRVVELATSITGAQVGQFFSDFGADVVLVEPPGGSRLRRQPAFAMWARGKRSIELDLRQPGQRQVLDGLVGEADVVVETFRPITREAFGLSYPVLASRNPRLIQVSITGFGSGPLANVKGYEALVMAKIGGLAAFSGMLSRPGPAFVSVPFASWSATQAALHGALVALFERESSGAGQHVETNLAHALGALDPFGWMVHWLTRQYPDAFTAAPPVAEDGIPNSSFTFRLLVALTADGRWLQFSQVQPRLFRALMRAFDLEWMFDDPRWHGVPELEDPAMRLEFWELMLDRARTKTLSQWQEVFAADHDVWAEVFRHGTELLHHPQMVHNGMVEVIPDVSGANVRQPGALVRIDDGPSARVNRPPPRLDQHGHEIRGASVARPAGGALAAEYAPAGRLPLEGVTVLELGTFYAAPFGATLLTDFGARVIKVEPLEGDPIRMLLPFPESGAARVLQGKESVALDIGSHEGREVVYELARRSDLVLQCFRAGVADRLRIDSASLRAIKPDLVYLNAPGYGIDGPNGHCPAFAPTIGAGAGFAWRNVGAAVAEGPDLTIADTRINSLRLTAATGPQFAQADGVAAMAVATGLLLGLVARRRGAGAPVMLTTMLSSAAHALSEDMVEYDGRAAIPAPDPDFYGLGALYRIYEASEGWIFLAVTSETQWAALVRALARHTNLADGRFSTPDLRRRSDAELTSVLVEVFRQQPATHWEGELLQADVGCVAIASGLPEANYIGELGRANGYVVEVDHPIFGEHPRLAPLVRFSRSAVTARPGCTLGQHTQSVLREIGYADEQIAGLRDQGVARTD